MAYPRWKLSSFAVLVHLSFYGWFLRFFVTTVELLGVALDWIVSNKNSIPRRRDIKLLGYIRARNLIFLRVGIEPR